LAALTRPAFPRLLAGLLLIGLGVQGARLVYAATTPAGPLGHVPPHQADPAAQAVAARFDPFFRTSSAPAANGTVTSLPLKLFGTRIDFATGQGSAIIATPDGVQSAFILGETIMAGAKLAAVAGDHVEIERSGVRERLYLDQSVPAPSPQPVAAPAPVAASPAPAPSPPPIEPLQAQP